VTLVDTVDPAYPEGEKRKKGNLKRRGGFSKRNTILREKKRTVTVRPPGSGLQAVAASQGGPLEKKNRGTGWHRKPECGEGEMILLKTKKKEPKPIVVPGVRLYLPGGENQNPIGKGGNCRKPLREGGGLRLEGK